MLVQRTWEGKRSGWWYVDLLFSLCQTFRHYPHWIVVAVSGVGGWWYTYIYIYIAPSTHSSYATVRFCKIPRGRGTNEQTKSHPLWGRTRRKSGEQPPCHRSQQGLITHGRVGSLVWSVGGYSSVVYCFCRNYVSVSGWTNNDSARCEWGCVY